LCRCQPAAGQGKEDGGKDRYYFHGFLCETKFC
jgi:hypothetical protein